MNGCKSIWWLKSPEGGICFLVPLCGSFYIFLKLIEKGKPVERRGRKAAGPSYYRDYRAADDNERMESTVR